jgi:hypothetical protein
MTLSDLILKMEGREAQKFLDVVVRPKIFFSKRVFLSSFSKLLLTTKYSGLKSPNLFRK